MRRGEDRWAGTAETGGGRRWKLCPDELMARSGQQADVEAFVVQEEGRSGTVGRCKRPEHGFTVTPWAAAMAAWWRCVARRRTATPLFIGELKAVERLTCAPRRGKVVRVAAWAVGAATTCSGLLAKGGEAVRRPAGERGTRGAGQRHVQELPGRRMDRRALACLDVRAQGETAAGARGVRADVGRQVPESVVL
jgi:hypothetical protein